MDALPKTAQGAEDAQIIIMKPFPSKSHPTPHDWPEDWTDENWTDEDNGFYFHVCTECHAQFMGHKRRPNICKVCAFENTEKNP